MLRDGWYADLWREALRDPGTTVGDIGRSFIAKIALLGVNLAVALALFAGLLIGFAVGVTNG